MSSISPTQAPTEHPMEPPTEQPSQAPTQTSPECACHGDGFSFDAYWDTHDYGACGKCGCIRTSHERLPSCTAATPLPPRPADPTSTPTPEPTLAPTPDPMPASKQ